jgi:hypothetical protein
VFLWASTIHDTVTQGSKYGFTIGSNKVETLNDVKALKKVYPDSVIYTYVKTTNPHNPKHTKLSFDIDVLLQHDEWRIYFAGDGEYSNSIRLSFKGNELNSLYRHRQYYELP